MRSRLVLNVVCFLLGNSPASEFYMPTFRNTLSVPSSYGDGTDKVFRNVGILKIQMPGNYPEESIQQKTYFIMRSALFWGFIQRRIVVCYRCSRTFCRFCLQGSSLAVEDGTDRLSINVGKNLQFCAS